MTRWLLIVGVTACGWLSACAADLEPPAEAVEPTASSQHPLEGSWQVEAVQSDTTCPDFEVFGPVEVTPVSMRRGEGSWTLDTAGISMRFDEVGPLQWSGSWSTPYEGCQLDAETLYRFEAVGPTSFAGWRTTSYRVSGADCGYANSACVVTHAVRGVR